MSSEDRGWPQMSWVASNVVGGPKCRVSRPAVALDELAVYIAQPCAILGMLSLFDGESSRSAWPVRRSREDVCRLSGQPEQVSICARTHS